MRKASLISLFVLMLIGIAACTYSWPTRPSPTPPPTPSTEAFPPTVASSVEPTSPLDEAPAGEADPLLPTSVQPCTITQHLVSVITTRETLTGTTTTEASLFPIQRIEYYPDALDMLAFLNSSTSEVNGPARLALARPVVDPQNPGLPDETTANSWVLLVPEGLVETALAWQNTRLEVPCSGQPTSLAIEWPIAEVLTFTQEMDPTDSLNAVDVARGKWTDPTDGGRVLYIDMLLVEELDQQGGKSWALYAFNVIPGAPGGPDRKTRFCCRWLGCKWATGYKAKVCRYWSCRRWMCNP